MFSLFIVTGLVPPLVALPRNGPVAAPSISGRNPNLFFFGRVEVLRCLGLQLPVVYCARSPRLRLFNYDVLVVDEGHRLKNKVLSSGRITVIALPNSKGPLEARPLFRGFEEHVIFLI